jgi:hypothetical protein
MIGSTGGRASYWKSGGQQEKRPRHRDAAKVLSAHRFCPARRFKRQRAALFGDSLKNLKFVACLVRPSAPE